jgi:PAS domain S-box-containing protein
MENSPEPASGGIPPPMKDAVPEQTLNPAFALLPVATLECDGAGRIEGFNAAAVELFGDAPVPGSPVEAATYRLLTVEGENIPLDRSPLAEALRTGIPQLNLEIIVERPDASRRAVIASALPRGDAQGNPTGAIQYLTDITERQPADDALRTSRAMFQTLFESAPDAILVVARGSGIIVRSNRQAEKMFGYAGAELQGQPVEMLLPQRFRLHHMGYHTQYLSKPRARPMGTGTELFGLRKDGSEFPVDVMLGALETEQGGFALAIVRDLSERRAAEAERQARQAAEAANQARSEFLANMSHELRSPLNTILGFTRLMAANPAVAALAGDDLERVLKSGKHLYALVNQVLDISRLDTGRASLDEADFDLFLLLDDLRDLYAPAAAAKGLQFLFSRRPKVSRYVRGDALKLRQVLINLVDNAVKFTDKGQISVSVELAELAQGTAPAGEPVSPMLHFEVADTGAGIAADELATLFHPFVPARPGRHAGQAPGLGMTISRGFVQLMGGEMHIDSMVGRGTTVSFEIPARIAATVGERRARFRQIRALADGQPRYRMLVVDDESEARELVARLLGPLGFSMREAANGQQAIDIWQEWHPQVIWMDLAMPVLDGMEAARRIKASANGEQTAIIALTALSGDEDRAKALAAGCDDVLYKPMRESDLVAALEKHLGVRFIYEETAAAAAPVLDLGALARLPLAQRAALEAALLALDSEAVDQIIESIGDSDPESAAALAAQAREFQYESILSALRAASTTASGGGAESRPGG